MKTFLKQFFFSLGVAFALTKMQTLFESVYLTIFLKQNLVTLLVALLAINCTTLGVVLTKIRELIDHSGKPGAFNQTRKEMMRSVNEQVILVGVSIILLLMQDSKWLQQYVFVVEFIQVFIITSFIFAIVILYDTAMSVFVILEYPDNPKEESNGDIKQC